MKEGPGFAFAEFQAAVESLKIELGAALIPILTDMIEVFKDNQGAISTVIGVFQSFIPVIQSFGPVLSTMIESFTGFIEMLNDRGAFEDMAEIAGVLAEQITSITDALGPLSPLLAVLISPILGMILVWSLFKDQIIFVIEAIGGTIRFVIDLISWIAFLVAGVVAISLAFWDWVGVLDPVISFLKGVVDLVQFLIEKIKQLGDALSESKIGQFLGDVKEGFSEGPDFGALGFQTGGQVRQTGLALVHTGETIVPANERERLGGSGGPEVNVENINISIATNEIDPVIIERKIRQSINLFRRR